MPKASRGRRPAPNPKRRTSRPGQHPIPMGAGATGILTAEEDAVEQTAPVMSAPSRPAPRPMPTARRAAANAVARRSFAESAADYRYVIGDLRRIGLFAGVLVVLLIGLSFVIR